jgi:hypothetical protein
MNLAPYVTSILRDMNIPGGRGSALHTFRIFTMDHRDHVHDLLMALANAVEPGPGVITVGAGTDLYANPARQGYAWRCGECLVVFRRGGRDPKSGVNYPTLQAADRAARKHSHDDHAGRVPVTEVTR